MKEDQGLVGNNTLLDELLHLMTSPTELSARMARMSPQVLEGFVDKELLAQLIPRLSSLPFQLDGAKYHQSMFVNSLTKKPADENIGKWHVAAFLFQLVAVYDAMLQVVNLLSGCKIQPEKVTVDKLKKDIKLRFSGFDKMEALEQLALFSIRPAYQAFIELEKMSKQDWFIELKNYRNEFTHRQKTALVNKGTIYYFYKLPFDGRSLLPQPLIEKCGTYLSEMTAVYDRVYQALDQFGLVAYAKRNCEI